MRRLPLPPRPTPGPSGEPPSLFIRATNDPAGQLAQALLRLLRPPVTYRTPDGRAGGGRPARASWPTPSDVPPTPPPCARPSATDTALLGRLLSDLAGRLPHNLVLVIDQVEEVFTLARTPEDAESRAAGLEMLRRAVAVQGDFKLIVCAADRVLRPPGRRPPPRPSATSAGCASTC